ncbi:excisionase family DNA-binding protein [Ktedonobacter racemifer]|uniref:DNA binding domain protein, excisionase family n=1 Tax=Ktedonobacter racemifer DSM 44963 TaxID=485913 RepID=D6TGH2_KTERA|nr:excisionase family DNA-binding protein [Ktedonobacter racemifer]EFH90684.1 DNA binding domain protein, excisionase family [Ktedonobacter racemifer DSM 44963]
MKRRTLTAQDEPLPPPMQLQPLLLDVDTVAVVLSMGRTKIYELIAREELPVLRFGKSVRVYLPELQAWIVRRIQSERDLIA